MEKLKFGKQKAEIENQSPKEKSGKLK